jgi:hypothetical protein
MKPSALSPARLAVLFAALAATLGAWQSLRLATANRALQTEISRRASRPGAPSPNTQEAPELVALQVELDRESSALRAAREKAGKIAGDLSIAPEEELKSLGHMEEIATESAQFLDSVQKVSGANPIASSKEEAARLAGIRKHLVGWSVKMDAIGKLESQPAQIARLHACTMRDVLELDPATTQRVQEALAAEFTLLRNQGLERMKRPNEEQDAWYTRRDAAMAAASERIATFIPGGQRQQQAETVSQVMHLGSGLRSQMITDPKGKRGGVQLFYQGTLIESLRL